MNEKNLTKPAQNQIVLTNFIVFLMAVGSTFTAANIYYIQPLLADIAGTFHLQPSNAGHVALMAQVGYAVGILFITPLSDIFEKKRLIMTTIFLCICSLILMATSGSIVMAAVATFAIGMTSIVPQMLIPFAAQLADEQSRGKVLGTVTSGLLVGILLSRTFSGILNKWIGWRNIYLLAAAILVVLEVVYLAKLPQYKALNQKLSYGKLLLSMPRMVIDYPDVIESAFTGGLVFSVFSAVWSSLIFHMSSPVFGLDSRATGLMGLIGIVGITTASVTGRLADKKKPRFLVGIGLGIVFLAIIVMMVFGNKMIGLIAGVMILDCGDQITFVSNQARVHSLDSQKRSRLNAIFMFLYFLCGAVGTFGGTTFYQHMGWLGVCIYCFIALAIGVVIHVLFSIFHKTK